MKRESKIMKMLKKKKKSKKMKKKKKKRKKRKKKKKKKKRKKKNNDEQLKIIKDREDYITKQTDIVFNNLKSVANQNEKAVEALRQENQQLKNQNYTLSKRLS